MCAYRVRRHELAPRSAAPRMPMPLLHLRSEEWSKGGQRPCSSPPAGAAIENCRWPPRRRQAIHRAGRLSTDVIGTESHVVDPAPIAVPRRHRSAKTDAIDGETLLRTLMAWQRGEPRVCAMTAPPSP